MINLEIITKLETISNRLYAVRLPVQEAAAYSSVLTCANEIARIAEQMKKPAETKTEEVKEEFAHDADNQPE